MGFNKVYQCLMDIFPQVDSRILKAVAIENSKDVDAAVEIVLSEVMPYLLTQTVVARSSTQNQSQRVQLNEDAAVDEEESNQLERRKANLGKRACSSTEPLLETNEVVKDAHFTGAASNIDSLGAPNVTTTTKVNEKNNNEAVDIESEELILLGNTEIGKDKSNVSFIALGIENSMVYKNPEIESGSSSKNQAICIGTEFLRTSHVSPVTVADDSTSSVENAGSSSSSTDDGSVSLNVDSFGCISSGLIGVGEENGVALTGPSSSQEFMHEGPKTGLHSESGSVFHSIDFEKQELGSVEFKTEQDCISEMGGVDSFGCISSSLIRVGEEKGSALTDPSSSQEFMKEGPKAGLHSESDSVFHSTDEKQDRGSVEIKSQQDCIIEMGDFEDDTFNLVGSRSNQTCRIDLLEEIIEDAKNNKKTLFQAMQSVMNLMKEVELQEEAAEQAKEEASRGGLDILLKVEELKEMLPHAKEENDMHAGEVYGEKAILATEVKELQSRLLSLSEERDKSLAILDEMHQTLEARQAAANELMKAVEQEKLEKEESARSALAEQEAIMAKVVEESKILRQEAEENSKLREFLMDRGQIVDSLQGEISVICEDVRLLKEKFDARIPLSKSISSSQTSCILASSGSSMKSMASDVGPVEWDTAKTLDKSSSPTPSADGQSPKSTSSEERCKADSKVPLDEGWEIFDGDAEF